MQRSATPGCCAGIIHYDLGHAHVGRSTVVSCATAEEFFQLMAGTESTWGGYPNINTLNIAITNSEQTKERAWFKEMGWDEQQQGNVRLHSITKSAFEREMALNYSPKAIARKKAAEEAAKTAEAKTAAPKVRREAYERKIGDIVERKADAFGNHYTVLAVDGPRVNLEGYGRVLSKNTRLVKKVAE